MNRFALKPILTLKVRLVANAFDDVTLTNMGRLNWLDGYTKLKKGSILILSTGLKRKTKHGVFFLKLEN